MGYGPLNAKGYRWFLRREKINSRAISCLHRNPALRLRTPFAARRASKPWLKVGQANIIRPSTAADRDVMAAMVVGAIDQQPAHTQACAFRRR
jgi:hypothetical protein